MALVLKDRVKVQSTTTGTGTLALSAAVTGFQSFSVIGDNVTYYTIQDPATGDWEVGYGTCASSGTTLSRDFVYDSSNSGNLVDFAAGTKEVFCTYPAEQAIYQETNGNLKLVGGVIGLTQDGTEGTTLPNTSFQAFTTGNYYMQANQQNLSSGAEASSDYICTANNGDDTDNYMDVGMASSGYNYAEYSAQKPNSGYILSTGSDLRLIAGKYGAETPGAQDIVLIAGSTKDTEERVRVYGDTGNVNIGGGVNATDLGKKLQVVGSASVSGAVTFGSTVTLSANPSTALQAATKQYVDNAASTGIHIHDPCVSETSAALSAVYTQGGTTFNITDITGTDTVVTSTAHGLSVDDEIWLYSTAGNGLSINTAYFVYATPSSTELQLSASFGGALLTGLTNASGLTYATRANSGVGAYLEASANEALPISGVTTSDRVLVYNQATGYWNGVYTVTALGSGGSKWKLTRATDANKYEPSNTAGLGAGDYFFIESNSESYVLTNPTGAVIIGYDAITYTLFSSVPSYTVTSPLQLVGTTLSLTTVPATLGGTGTSTTTAGDLLYSATSNNWSKLAIGTSEYPLIVSGGLPAWGTLNLAGAGVSGVLPESHGGTNQSSYATGDTLYASAANTLSKLSGNTSTTKKYLNQTGTGSASQAPVWDTISATDIASGTLAVARGGTGLGSYAVGDIVYASGTGTLAGLADVATGNVLLSGGANTAPSYGKVNLGTHITGTLPTANGGTALTSFTANGVVYASSTSALATGSVLNFNGTNLGLGVAPKPLWVSGSRAIEVSGGIGGSTVVADLGAESWFGYNAYNDNTWRYITSGVATGYKQSGGEHQWLTAASGTAGNAITFTQAMTLDTSGNLKVGTTAGSAKLNVAVSNSATYQLAANFTNSANADFQIQIKTSSTLLTPSTATPLGFGTAGTERMRIDGSGNITTTSRPTFNGNLAIDVGNLNSYAPTLTGGGAYGTWYISIIGNASSADSAGYVNNAVTFNNSGSGAASGTTYNGSAVKTISYNTVGAANGYGNLGTTDLNTVTVSGMYRFDIPSANGPGISYGQLIVAHGASDTITQIAGDYSTGSLYTRSGNPSNVGGTGSWQAWRKVLDALNYTSYAPSLTGSGASGTWGINVSGNAATATNATNAGYVANDSTNMRFHWSGQSGQPTWLWGGNASGDMYVYNPSNFSVNYATSAGSATTAANYLPLAGGTMTGTIYSSTSSLVIGQYGGATRGYLYNDTGAFGMLRWDGNWAFSIPYGAGYCIASESMRSPIFYDTNNTGYYCDPNGTSQFSRVNADSFFYGNGSWSYFTGIYDTNDTGYYLDPNSTSNLNAAYFQSTYKNGYGMYACRAWVNFNGTGTIAVRGSENISSIGDVATGRYKLNFSTSLADANYSVLAMGSASGLITMVLNASGATNPPTDMTAAGVEIKALNSGGTTLDSYTILAAVFR